MENKHNSNNEKDNNKKDDKLKQQIINSNMHDNQLLGIFKYLFSGKQQIDILSSYFPKINCNNNYNEIIFASYVNKIINYYKNDCSKLITEEINNTNNKKQKNILNDILQHIQNINEKTTIGSILNIQRKLNSNIISLNKHNYSNTNTINECINILRDLIKKINMENISNEEQQKFKKLTLADLIYNNKQLVINKTIKKVENSFLDELD